MCAAADPFVLKCGVGVPPFQVAKPNPLAVALLIKPALDVAAHVVQNAHIHLTHLLPPLSTGLDIALLCQHNMNMRK